MKLSTYTIDCPIHGKQPAVCEDPDLLTFYEDHEPLPVVCYECYCEQKCEQTENYIVKMLADIIKTDMDNTELLLLTMTYDAK